MMLLWAIRFFIFKLYESPKFLMGRGRDAEAVEVVHKVAQHNRRSLDDDGEKRIYLTVEDLAAAGNLYENTEGLDTSAKGAVARQLRKFNTSHVRALFATRKLAYSTTLLIILWGSYFSLLLSITFFEPIIFLAFIGLAFPL